MRLFKRREKGYKLMGYKVSDNKYPSINHLLLDADCQAATTGIKIQPRFISKTSIVSNTLMR